MKIRKNKWLCLLLSAALFAGGCGISGQEIPGTAGGRQNAGKKKKVHTENWGDMWKSFRKSKQS